MTEYESDEDLSWLEFWELSHSVDSLWEWKRRRRDLKAPRIQRENRWTTVGKIIQFLLMVNVGMEKKPVYYFLVCG